MSPHRSRASHRSLAQASRGFGVAVLLGMSAVAMPAVLSAQEHILIRAERMIDGKGNLTEPGAVVVLGDRIVAVGSEATTMSGDNLVDLGDATLLPGLIDLHTHLTDKVGTHWEQVLITTTPAQAALYGAANALTTLRAGFTTVRDMGPTWSYTDVDLRDAIDAGVIPGPRMQVAGNYVSATGGAGDARQFSIYVDVPTVRNLADGVDAVRAAVRTNHKNGADFTKILATGAVLSQGLPPGAQQYSYEELAVAVEETNRWGRFTAAHAHGTEGIKAAIRAGVRTVDHGSMLDDEAIAMLQDSDYTYYVPTLYVGVIVPRDGAALGIPEPLIQRSTEMMRYRNATFGRALEAGLTIGFGTDAGVFEHGHNAREFQIRVEIGESEMDAITSATSISAMIMGWEADVGSLEAGKYADIIAVPGNPLDDITALERVTWVMKGGEIYRSDRAERRQEPVDGIPPAFERR
ncbi:MAG: amidohydrolase family protein [Gemmatimonadetes bacterium]|nr:amidohydrolase family protein [Gemmatimonadota bacterium]